MDKLGDYQKVLFKMRSHYLWPCSFLISIPIYSLYIIQLAQSTSALGKSIFEMRWDFGSPTTEQI